jgi:adenylate cyclase
LERTAGNSVQSIRGTILAERRRAARKRRAMNPRFILVAFLVAVTAMLGAAGYLASRVAVFLIPLAVAAVGFLIVKRIHSASGTRRRIREKNDLCFQMGCRSGVTSQIRKLYRRLPSNPRCRFCLVPFGGIGRALGIAPSRKNPNFCPG